MVGFRSWGGHGCQEALMISAVSGSAAAAAKGLSWRTPKSCGLRWTNFPGPLRIQKHRGASKPPLRGIVDEDKQLIGLALLNSDIFS
jgi:hypothetical protein